MSVAKNQLQAFGTVANVELRAGLEGKTLLLERFQHAHVRKETAVIGKKRFANVEAGEMFLLQHQHAFADACEKGSCAAAARPAADDYHVVHLICHGLIKMQNRLANKHEDLDHLISGKVAPK